MEMEEILENLDKELDKLLSGDNFEPAKRDIDKQVVVKASKHIAITSNGDNLDELTKPAIEKDDQDDDLKIYLQELDDLIGLKNVKDEITSLISTVAINKKREEMGLKVPDFSNHLVFFGNPGTGKTSVARILAKVYKALGFLSKGQLIEKDRAGLVAGYVGQTAIKCHPAN
jgi:SpoVK/Ycf46/Vps4 family AAA+-type ATPase